MNLVVSHFKMASVWQFNPKFMTLSFLCKKEEFLFLLRAGLPHSDNITLTKNKMEFILWCIIFFKQLSNFCKLIFMLYWNEPKQIAPWKVRNQSKSYDMLLKNGQYCCTIYWVNGLKHGKHFWISNTWEISLWGFREKIQYISWASLHRLTTLLLLLVTLVS